MKSFSTEYCCTTNHYDDEFLPLLHRTSNLEELTSNIRIDRRTGFIDGLQVKNDILAHLPRLSKFMFHIHTKAPSEYLSPYLSSEEDIQRSFAGVANQLVACVLTPYFYAATCHVVSVPPH